MHFIAENARSLSAIVMGRRFMTRSHLESSKTDVSRYLTAKWMVLAKCEVLIKTSTPPKHYQHSMQVDQMSDEITKCQSQTRHTDPDLIHF